MVTTIILLSILLIILLISWRALYLKNTKLQNMLVEAWDDNEKDRLMIKETVEHLTNEAIRTYARLTIIDQGGSFQADDEVGETFQAIRRQVDKYKTVLKYMADEWDLEYKETEQEDGEEEG